jgi:ADP-ribosylglycohydrolase
MELKERIKGMLFGIATGDALGVPVEFCKRQSRIDDPVQEMRAFGTHHQPAGTWSDDSSLVFCTVEAMLKGYSTELLGRYFLDWFLNGYWSAHGSVFDIGIATSQALQRIKSGFKAELAGGDEEMSNGNGSLMRIAPLIWECKNLEASERFHFVASASSITHRHLRSILACHYLIEFIRLLAHNSLDKMQAFNEMCRSWESGLLVHSPECANEISAFSRILQPDFHLLPEEELSGSGYVVNTLETSVWCLLNSGNFRDSVLMAVNFGDDTDTTAAVTGALAGTYYGSSKIPLEWKSVIARSEDIENLALRLINRESER